MSNFRFTILAIIAVCFSPTLASSQPSSPESGGFGGAPTATPTPTPTPTPTLPPIVDCLSRNGYQWDYNTNSCKECIYSVTVIRNNMLILNDNGQVIGDPNYQHPDDQKATFGPNDVVVGFDLTGGAGSGPNTVNIPFLNDMNNWFNTQINQCYNPMDVNSSECVTYGAFMRFAIDYRQESDWAKPVDPSFAFKMRSPTPWWFGDIRQVWITDPVTGQLRATRHARRSIIG